ncbi:MAG: ATPase, T2SS/T4P/T4SS family [Actinomycetota bacterium]|nr:ATPase, T2SS/T4P/T4SS family [Actinomycetota bacterium]
MSLKDRITEKTIKESELEKEIIRRVKKRIKSKAYNLNPVFKNKEDFKDKIFLIIKKEVEEYFNLVNYKIKDEMIERIFYDTFGLGILEVYLCDKEITDIFIHGLEMVIIKNGQKIFLGQVFSNLDEVFLIIDRIKENSGKIIDQRIPFLNTDLYEGSRCSIVIPPVSDKVYISIRVFNCLDFQIDDLEKVGMFDKKVKNQIKSFIKNKRNIIIAGGMGTGKTTLLNTLIKLIPENEFINIIQDTPEIKPLNHPYSRLLTTRVKSREIDYEINQERLLFETLRMKADRIIIGEIRENVSAYQLLQALNTGHKGSFSTIHADSAFDALIRLESLAMEYRQNLSNTMIKRIIARAINVVIYLENQFDEKMNIIRRKIKEIITVDKKLSKEGGYKLVYL